MFLLALQRVPGVAPAFTLIERTTWFQPTPDCLAYRQSVAGGFTPQLAHDAVIASIEAPYTGCLDGRAGR